MSQRQPLPKTVIALGWVSFFADICSEMVYPLIPIFLRSVLGTPASLMGLIEGAAESVVSLMKGWSGFHSDRTGKRMPYIQWGYGLSALGKPLIGLAFAWHLVMVARVTDRVGKGIRTTARDTVIADVVPSEDRGRAFGYHRAMDTGGALVGVVIAIAFVQWMSTQLRLAFLLAAIPGAIAVWLTLRVREPERKSEVKRVGAQLTLKELMTRLKPDYWVALGISLMFALAGSSDTFLLWRAGEMGLSPTMVVLAYACYNVTFAASSYPSGVLSDRFGRWAVMTPGWLLYGLVYLGFAYVSHGAWLWLLFAIYGLAIGASKGVGTALIADHSPPEAAGSAMGLFYMATGLATLLGNVVTGVLYDRAGHQTAFLFNAAAALAGILLVPFALRRPRPQGG